MIQKEQIKEFFSRYRRVIVSVSMCVFAFILVTAIAIGTSNEAKLEDDTINTSTPTAIEFIMPVENGTIIKDFSNTSLKYNSTLNQWESHKGLDIKGSDDANVLCVYDGEVVSVETNYLTGTVVKIRHNNSLETVYGSLDENVCVKVGDRLKKGDVIGKVSTSAKAELNDGAHLHFEVLLDNVKTDPNLYLESSNK